MYWCDRWRPRTCADFETASKWAKKKKNSSDGFTITTYSQSQGLSQLWFCSWWLPIDIGYCMNEHQYLASPAHTLNDIGVNCVMHRRSVWSTRWWIPPLFHKPHLRIQVLTLKSSADHRDSFIIHHPYFDPRHNVNYSLGFADFSDIVCIGKSPCLIVISSGSPESPRCALWTQMNWKQAHSVHPVWQ